MLLTGNLKKDCEALKRTVDSDDIVFFSFLIDGVDATAVYSDTLADKNVIGKQVVAPLSELKSKPCETELLKSVTLPGAEKLFDISDAADKIVDGDVIILTDGLNFAISAKSRNPAVRAVTEPPTSSVLKGPREGFVESMRTNVSLIRQRLKTPFFRYKKLSVGKYSQTSVGIVYLDGVADDDLVNALKGKIEKINVDGIVDSSYIIKCISDRKTTLFRQVGTTEKPDVLAAKLLEGRIAVMVDGSPIVLTVPLVLIEDFQSGEDYYINAYRANFSRFLRLSAVILAIYLPAFFVSAQLFHLQIIPLNFLLTIVGSIKGIPLSPSVEMFLTLFIFEVLNEASIRMPKYVGIAMSIVGALVLGETAVSAGIVSTPTIIIVALSGICIYTVPDLTETISVLRLIFLVVGGTFGGYGIILLSCAILTYLSGLDSFGIPYLAPYAPLIKNDLQDALTMSFYAETIKRPLTLKPENKTRKKV